eukprot:328380-Karenia_brevis.AAC.1
MDDDACPVLQMQVHLHNLETDSRLSIPSARPQWPKAYECTTAQHRSRAEAPRTSWAFHI